MNAESESTGASEERHSREAYYDGDRFGRMAKCHEGMDFQGPAYRTSLGCRRRALKDDQCPCGRAEEILREDCADEMGEDMRESMPS